jgi:two-component system, NtrC family, response regulator HydG
LPLEVQGKLLRVLEDGLVTPEGADKPLAPVDVQVLAATNADVPQMIRRKEFRADLFHRMATLRVALPPLRERGEDIDLIAESVLEELAGEQQPRKLTRQELRCLHDYDWPGNVRQLRQVLLRAVKLGTPIAEVIAEERQLGLLTPAEADSDEETVLPRTIDDIRPIKEIQRQYAQRALTLHGGNLQQTAEALGIATNTLRTWLKQQ